MVKSFIVYQGEKHCELTHGPSGSKIETDAPKDNQGRGERFSPTDLAAAALGSCALTVTAMAAEKDGLSLIGAQVEVEKEMLANPRRIGRLTMRMSLPKKLTPTERSKLEEVALNCPVIKSLHPDIDIQSEFIYI